MPSRHQAIIHTNDDVDPIELTRVSFKGLMVIMMDKYLSYIYIHGNKLGGKDILPTYQTSV